MYRLLICVKSSEAGAAGGGRRGATGPSAVVRRTVGSSRPTNCGRSEMPRRCPRDLPRTPCSSPADISSTSFISPTHNVQTSGSPDDQSPAPRRRLSGVTHRRGPEPSVHFTTSLVCRDISLVLFNIRLKNKRAIYGATLLPRQKSGLPSFPPLVAILPTAPASSKCYYSVSLGE